MHHAKTHTLIVGLGLTGLSVARYLLAQGVPFAVVDTRNNPPGLDELQALDPEIPVYLGSPLALSVLTRAERIIISPGVSLQNEAIVLARDQGMEIYGDIELFAHEASAPIAAITGSNGKSTVVTLLTEMAAQAGLDVRLGGNIGVPAMDLLTTVEPDLYVLELSSFQLDSLYTLKPAVAGILNLTADHMDRYQDLRQYQQSKARIYAGARQRVVNRDDPAVKAMAGDRGVISFGLDQPRTGHFGLVAQRGQSWLAHGADLLLPEDALRIPGRHNTANALAALAFGDALGLDYDAMLQTLRNFTGLAHRCQWVTQSEGVDWYNDSKGTNAGATQAAITGLPGFIVLIAGGVAKSADFTALRPAVASKVRAAVLLGQDAAQIEKALAQTTSVVHAKDMVSAVSAAKQLAQPGDSVLLSPACASFDMFPNFMARGDAFIEAVKAVCQ